MQCHSACLTYCFRVTVSAVSSHVGPADGLICCYLCGCDIFEQINLIWFVGATIWSATSTECRFIIIIIITCNHCGRRWRWRRQSCQHWPIRRSSAPSRGTMTQFSVLLSVRPSITRRYWVTSCCSNVSDIPHQHRARIVQSQSVQLIFHVIRNPCIYFTCTSFIYSWRKKSFLDKVLTFWGKVFFRFCVENGDFCSRLGLIFKFSTLPPRWLLTFVRTLYKWWCSSLYKKPS